MSSKDGAHRASKELLMSLLRLIADSADITDSYAKKLRYVQRVGYVRKNGAQYTLTPRGEKMLSEGTIGRLRIPAAKRWDHKWRIVMFDIPVDRRKRRDTFRRHLRELGLTLYQNSVWIYPYPLEDIIEKVANFYMLSNCVSIIVAEKVTGEEKLKRKYKLS